MKNNPDIVAAVRVQSEISRAMAMDVAVIAGDTAQIRENLHDLRDKVAAQIAGHDDANLQLQKAMGEIHDKLNTVLTRLEFLANDVNKGFREDRERLRALEANGAEATGRHGV